MRSLHLAALALLTIAALMAGCEGKAFWLLMRPPIQSGGQVNIDAPIKSWTPVHHVFGSLSECEKMKHADTSFDWNKQNMQIFEKMFKNLSQAQLDATKTMLSHMTCISSDDPRLRE